MNKMSETVRKQIIDIAHKAGFAVQTKTSGTDEYVKHLMFQMPNSSHFLFIRKQGISTNSAGMPNYFQVAVHPDEFRPELIAPEYGIEDLLNRQSKQNLFASSNYRGFPDYPSYKEPCGKCYRAENIKALEHLLHSLAASLLKSHKEHL